MGPHRATALIGLALFCVSPAAGQQSGWHYSSLPSEGDRASMGCARESDANEFSCLVVRCEDDYSVGVHVHTSRPGGDAGTWEMTLDREARQLDAVAGASPYGARLDDPDGWLLDGLRHGTFVYLRHNADMDKAFAFIDLSGSFRSIAEALHWCAPRVPTAEQFGSPDVGPPENNGEAQ